MRECEACVEHAPMSPTKWIIHLSTALLKEASCMLPLQSLHRRCGDLQFWGEQIILTEMQSQRVLSAACSIVVFETNLLQVVFRCFICLINESDDKISKTNEQLVTNVCFLYILYSPHLEMCNLYELRGQLLRTKDLFSYIFLNCRLMIID